MFRNCNSGARGGGLWVGYFPSDFKMQNTIFINCHASSWGGGLRFVCSQSYTEKDHKFFYYCYFSGNKGTNGDDLGFYLENVEYEKGPFETSFSSSSTKGRRFNWQNKGYQSEWLTDGILNRYVKWNGEDSGIKENEEVCGVKEEEIDDKKRCKTISYSVGLIESKGGWWINILDNIEENQTRIIKEGIFANISGAFNSKTSSD